MTEADKKEIRKKILGIRRALTEEYLLENSARIAHFIAGTEAWQRSETVYLYAAVSGEVRTDLLAEYACRAGKRLAYPCVRGREMVFIRADSKTVFAKSAFGVPEPCGDTVEDGPGFMCVPGIAFDPAGARLGFGGGYYDRYLSAHKDLVTCGLAFSFQIISGLPKEAHDVPVGCVVTEQGFVIPDGRSAGIQ